MKRLLILSGKGGTGKTTTAAAFVELSRTKAFGDCDVDAPNLHLVTNFADSPEEKPFLGAQKAQVLQEQCIGCGACAEACRFGAIIQEGQKVQIRDYACEGCGVCQYVCPAKAIEFYDDVAGTQYLYKGRRVFSTARLKMGRGNSGKLVSAVKLDLFKNAPETDLLIIDGSPGIGCPVIASVSGMDLVLVVAESSLSGISDLQRLLKTAQTFETPLAVCINKWDINPEASEKIRRFCRDRGLPFLGVIPYDPLASQAINEGRTLAGLESPAGKALEELYRNVLKQLHLQYDAEDAALQ